MSLIEYEGRQIELPNEITSDDEKLLEVLLPYFPELSQATIERKAGQPIKIIKQAKTKGVEESQKELSVLHNNSVFQCQIKTHQILSPTPLLPLSYSPPLPISHSPLSSLMAAPEEPNQAVQLTWVLQCNSINGYVTPLTLASRTQEISQAIARGEEELQRFKATLKKLQLAPAAVHPQIPLNF